MTIRAPSLTFTLKTGVLALAFTLPCLALTAGAARSSEEDAATSAQQFDPRVPLYKQLRPRWGVEASTSMNAFGGNPSTPYGPTSKIWAVSLQLDYQPAWIQRFGVLSFGPSANVYPVLPPTDLTNGRFSIWSLGAQIRYQARYVREQILVPTVGYDIQSMSYGLNANKNGRTTIQGSFYGLMLLLNPLDPISAADFYGNYKIMRTYLVGEVRTLSSSDPVIAFSQPSAYFGLRLEY